ncbi:hypothetical protein Tco_0867362 [Tanacetum coccineum]
MFKWCSAMFRGTPVISAGFQAKISKFCLSKEHSSLRPISVNVDPMSIVCSGYGADFPLCPPPINSCLLDVDLTTMKFIHAEVECTSSPILTTRAIWPSGQMVSPLNPISDPPISTSIVCFDMAGHPSPRETKMPDPRCERISFLTCPRLGESYEMVSPFVDAFLLLLQFFLLGDSDTNIRRRM